MNFTLQDYEMAHFEADFRFMTNLQTNQNLLLFFLLHVAAVSVDSSSNKGKYVYFSTSRFILSVFAGTTGCVT